MTVADHDGAAMPRAPDAEDDLLGARTQLAQLEARLQAAHAETIGVRARLNAAADRITLEAAEADLIAAERDAVLGRAMAAERALADLTAQIAVTTMQLVQDERDTSQALLTRAKEAEHRIDVLLGIRATQEARVQALRTDCLDMVDANATRLTEDAALFALARRLAARRTLIGLLRRSGGARLATVRAQADGFGVGKLIAEPALGRMLARRTLVGLLRRSTSSAEALLACALMQAAQETRLAAVVAIGIAQRG